MADQALLDMLAAKATKLRVDSIKTTTEAGSGHPTTCLSAADIVATLFFAQMRYDPQDPNNPNNDKFLLSKGHGAPILYSAYAEAGALDPALLMTLRRIDSDLEGHPTPKFPWAYVGTGSLGQGLSIGAGMAANGKYLDKLDYRVYVVMGDGEVAEGAIWEAAGFAAYHKLDNLVGIVDVNRLGQSQETMYEHDLAAYSSKFAAFGWHTIEIDGHDFGQILAALEEAKGVKERPTAILARTLKGKGVSFVENKNGFHGKPMSAEDCEKALAELPLSDEAHDVQIPAPSPAEMAPVPCCTPAVEAPSYAADAKVATREAYGTALAKLGAVDPRIVALDGDVKNSTFADKFLEAHPDRYFECFIAEQNMVGVAVGLANRGKIPFLSSFAAFFCRAYDQIRMAGISLANIKVVGSHAGVSIGEDGPSQMGLEDIAMMRAIPNCIVLYPSDPVSSEKLVAEAARYQGMAYVRTSRPKTGVLYDPTEEFPVGGAKVLKSSDADQATVVAAGVTVHEALEACALLADEGISIRVIDAYSVKPLAKSALLEAAQQTAGTLITVEDHYPEGGLGEAAAAALAPEGVRVHVLAVNGIPRSGKADELLDAFGISARGIVEKVKAII